MRTSSATWDNSDSDDGEKMHNLISNKLHHAESVQLIDSPGTRSRRGSASTTAASDASPGSTGTNKQRAHPGLAIPPVHPRALFGPAASPVSRTGPVQPPPRAPPSKPGGRVFLCVQSWGRRGGLRSEGQKHHSRTVSSQQSSPAGQ